MMGAASLPLPQGSMPPGFAAFLTTIGQTPNGGEAGSFDQLLAAAPVNGLLAMKIEPALPAADVVAVANTAVTVPMPPAPISIAAPVAEAGVVSTDVVRADVVRADVAVDTSVAPAKADEANVDTDTSAVVASAEKLLIAAKGSAPAPQPTAGKDIEAEAETKTETKADSTAAPQPKTGKLIAVKVEVDVTVAPEVKTDSAQFAAPEIQVAAVANDPAKPADSAASWIPVVAAAPVAGSVVGKPAKASEAVALSTGDAVPVDVTASAAALATKPRSPDGQPPAPTSGAATAAKPPIVTLPTGDTVPVDAAPPAAPLATKPRSPDEKPTAPTSGAATAAKPPIAALITGDTVPADATAPAAPLATKPRSPDRKPAAPTNEAVPIAATAAKPQTTAQPLPTLVIAGTERAAAKPADIAPSMTVLFAQPAATGAVLPTDAARPIAGAERVLDMDSDGAWIDQLAHDIAATKSDRGDISFRLMPRHLGRLDVAMLMSDQGVALKMDTQHEATATIVTAAQSRLVDELRQQGVRVAGSEVTCTPGETGRQAQSQGQGQGRAGAADPAHLIETATERAEARDKEEAADRRGRFA